LIAKIHNVLKKLERNLDLESTKLTEELRIVRLNENLTDKVKRHHLVMYAFCLGIEGNFNLEIPNLEKPIGKKASRLSIEVSRSVHLIARKFSIAFLFKLPWGAMNFTKLMAKVLEGKNDVIYLAILLMEL
jgi:hypothetical protein